MNNKNETRIEIDGDLAVKLAEAHGFRPFDCECTLAYEGEILRRTGETPEQVSTSTNLRFYLVVREK